MEINWKIPQTIIEINEYRLKENNNPYNPLVGTIVNENAMPRVLISIPDAPIPEMYIPVEMEVEPIVLALHKG